MTLYLQLGRLGDVINLLPLAWDDAQNGKRSAIMTCREFASVLEGCSYVDAIPFDGQPHELERAMDVAQRLAEDVRCCQVMGPPELVKKYSYGRFEKPHAIMDSFQKEAWRLAGRMDAFGKNLPLVFDRRNPEREKELLKTLFDPTLRPVVLLSISGKSSPFQGGALLRHLVQETCLKKGFLGVDISEVRGERFFDLLGLYESATMLISTDSAPLHLARACDIPVVALVNDSPLLWNGSAWKPNHILHIRYRDFQARALEIVKAIENQIWMDGPRPHLNGTTGFSVYHAYSQYQGHKPNRIIGVDRGAQLGVFGHDTRNAMKDPERFPFVRDVIRLATVGARPHDVVVLTRDGANIDDGIVSAGPGVFWSFRRTQLPEGSNPPIERMMVPDLFIFTVAWWKENQEHYPHMVMGRDPHWARCLHDLMRLCGGVELDRACIRPPPTRYEPRELAPRRLHNIALYNIFHEGLQNDKNRGLTGIGVVDIFPKVSEQIPIICLNQYALFPGGYNGSLTTQSGQRLLAYRWHHDGTTSTNLAMAELNADYSVTSNQALRMNGNSVEDARLFWSGGGLNLCYVDSLWPAKPECSVRVARLKKTDGVWTVSDQRTLRYGGNGDPGTMQKNWVFFNYDGGLHFIYQCWPKHIVVTEGGREYETEPATDLGWEWGQPRGGTVPLPFEGKLLRFFHSRLDNEMGPERWRYFLGAYIMEPQPPFAVLACSQKPIAIGSGDDDLAPQDRAALPHWKKRIIFPMGAIEADGGWHVSIGLNDAYCAVARISSAMLNL